MTRVIPAALEDIACSAIETLLVLQKHQQGCRQCQIDDTFCDTAGIYQKSFMQDVRRYARTKAGDP